MLGMAWFQRQDWMSNNSRRSPLVHWSAVREELSSGAGSAFPFTGIQGSAGIRRSPTRKSIGERYLLLERVLECELHDARIHRRAADLSERCGIHRKSWIAKLWVIEGVEELPPEFNRLAFVEYLGHFAQ